MAVAVWQGVRSLVCVGHELGASAVAVVGVLKGLHALHGIVSITCQMRAFTVGRKDLRLLRHVEVAALERRRSARVWVWLGKTSSTWHHGVAGDVGGEMLRSWKRRADGLLHGVLGEAGLSDLQVHLGHALLGGLELLLETKDFCCVRTTVRHGVLGRCGGWAVAVWVSSLGRAVVGLVEAVLEAALLAGETVLLLGELRKELVDWSLRLDVLLSLLHGALPSVSVVIIGW